MVEPEKIRSMEGKFALTKAMLEVRTHPIKLSAVALPIKLSAVALPIKLSAVALPIKLSIS
jgi:hypothetical protein